MQRCPAFQFPAYTSTRVETTRQTYRGLTDDNVNIQVVL